MDKIAQAIVEGTAARRRAYEFLADRSFCGNGWCSCAIDDPVPCESFCESFHRYGRCARCGWARGEHTELRRSELTKASL